MAWPPLPPDYVRTMYTAPKKIRMDFGMPNINYQFKEALEASKLLVEFSPSYGNGKFPAEWWARVFY